MQVTQIRMDAKKHYGIIALILGFAIMAEVCEGSDTSTLTPQEVVAAYLRLDANGAWITEEGREKLQRFTAAQIYVATILAPNVINGYRIESVELRKDEASISVEYDLIGRTENFSTFDMRRSLVTQEILVKKVGGQWKIQTELFPYISWIAVVRYLQEQKEQVSKDIALVKDDVKRRKLERGYKIYLNNKDRIIHQIYEARKKPVSSAPRWESENVISVIKKYCELDSLGVRTDPELKKQITPYVTWNINGKNMSSEAVLISDCSVGMYAVYGNSARVTVIYNVIGKYADQKETRLRERREHVDFELIKTDDGWKIDKPDDLLPHVMAGNVKTPR